MTETANRRPLKSRDTGWAKQIAAMLGDAGVDANLISAASVAVAILGAALLVWAGASRLAPLRAGLFLVAAISIQLRLLCNLLDGMVAVEHGRGTPAGPIWNELPDRLADLVLLTGAGYAVSSSGVRFGAAIGWFCGALAILTAYVRELGRGLGFPADFSGPMAKPHRMAALTVACIVSALEPLWGWRGAVLMAGLVIIAIGTAFTVARRTRTLAGRLAARAQAGETP